MNTINFWPILVSAAAAFAIGAFWYSPVLFGKEWVSLTGTVTSDTELGFRKNWKKHISQFVAMLIMFAVLGFLISATNSMTWSDGAFLGFIVWLGFTATEAVSGMLWERKSLNLTLIHSIASLVVLVIGGAIIGAW